MEYAIKQKYQVTFVKRIALGYNYFTDTYFRMYRGGTMNKQEKYLYWLDAAEYDIATADSMLNSGRYLYVVFMCQQALEKLAKGLYAYFVNGEVPRVHNIGYILS